MHGLAVFSPYESASCVVSQEGMTLHTASLSCLYSYTNAITDCCYCDDILAIGFVGSISIFLFEPNSTPRPLFLVESDPIGFPCAIKREPHFLILVYLTEGVVTRLRFSFKKSPNN
jgi:hypothetical protein